MRKWILIVLILILIGVWTYVLFFNGGEDEDFSPGIGDSSGSNGESSLISGGSSDDSDSSSSSGGWFSRGNDDLPQPPALPS